MIDHLFGYPIWCGKLELPGNLKEELITECDKLPLETPKGWYCNVMSTYMKGVQIDQDANDRLMAALKDPVMEYFISVFDRGMPQSHMDVWFNKYTKGMYQEYHYHPYSYLSGIYVLKVPNEDSACTRFHNPCRIGAWFYDEIKQDPNGIPEPKSSLAHSYKFVAEENDLIIFPSFLPHDVIPHQSDDPRYTFSFNLQKT